MSTYTGSKGQVGLRTILSIGSTPTVVGEVKSLKLNGRKWDTDDSTNMQSLAKEFISTIQDPGEWDIDFTRVSNDVGQIALEAAFASGAITTFTIQLPVNTKAGQSTTGDKFAFNALVTEVPYNFETTKIDSGSCKLKMSGPMTITVGS
jgi:hypothetical protein